LHHPGLQTRRSHDVAIGGDGEAAGIDEKRDLLCFSQGVLEEGDGGVIRWTKLSKPSQGVDSIYEG
jgi:hypothetical protein